MFDQQLYPSQKYHSASKNNSGFMHALNEHLIHYRDDIVKLKDKVSFSFRGTTVPLPRAVLPNVSMEHVLENRRSRRDFTHNPITLKNLATLLHYSAGYKHSEAKHKYVPSSGGMNSVEVFAFVLSSEEIPLGAYHYSSFNHELELVNLGDYREWLKTHVFFQQEFSQASVVFVLTSMIGKLTKKYLMRSYRLGLIDVGHVSQNLYLAGTALGLKVCASAGFIDHEVDEALKIDGDENASFLTVMVN